MARYLICQMLPGNIFPEVCQTDSFEDAIVLCKVAFKKERCRKKTVVIDTTIKTPTTIGQIVHEKSRETWNKNKGEKKKLGPVVPVKGFAVHREGKVGDMRGEGLQNQGSRFDRLATHGGRVGWQGTGAGDKKPDKKMKKPLADDVREELKRLGVSGRKKSRPVIRKDGSEESYFDKNLVTGGVRRNHPAEEIPALIPIKYGQ